MDGIYTEACPLCRVQMKFPATYYGDQLCSCPNCGEYIYNSTYVLRLGKESNKHKKNKLLHFLFHNNTNGRVKFIGTNEAYEKFLENKPDKPIQLVDFDTVENWYPKTFTEKIDNILLYLGCKSKYMGESVIINLDELSSLFLMATELGTKEWNKEFLFTFNYLIRNEMIISSITTEQLSHVLPNLGMNKKLGLTLSAKAWERIYELQKTQSNNKNVFVAMKFGKETEELREKLKEGIREAGYEPIIMDGVEHNHQIVPEMLYQIKNSKFIIAELSHHNNGAYYEAGYALGLGKEVIHICKRRELTSGLHFDVAQVNTIVYDDIEELPAKIVKRIKATIG